MIIGDTEIPNTVKVSNAFMGYCPDEIVFTVLNFHFISPNATKYTIRLNKKILCREKNITRVFFKNVQDCKNRSGYMCLRKNAGQLRIEFYLSRDASRVHLRISALSSLY